jgi:hypothetical protein
METVTSDIAGMNTDELESYIDYRYEAGAPQKELDLLEIEYSKRVSEDDLNMTEDEPDMREAYDMGVDLEEWLAIEYYQFIHPEERIGGMETKDYFKPETFNDFLTLNLKAGITRKDIMVAAKDAYEYKRNLIIRQKSSNKISNIPEEMLIKK